MYEYKMYVKYIIYDVIRQCSGRLDRKCGEIIMMAHEHRRPYKKKNRKTL